jgi:hypothetical protein
VRWMLDSIDIHSLVGGDIEIAMTKWVT